MNETSFAASGAQSASLFADFLPCLAAGLICLAAPGVVGAETNSLVRAVSRVSANLPSDLSGNSDSTDPIFSDDGRFVVFTSAAVNLTGVEDSRGHLDIFLQDLANRTTMLVSQNAAETGPGNNDSYQAAVSGDGRFVVFESAASDLVTNDFNGATDIFIRDLVLGQTTLVSADASLRHSGNGPSSNPDLTPDGRCVVFESGANDLAANDRNLGTDVFVRDWQSGVTTLVSLDTRPPPASTTVQSGAAESGAMTPDGRFVAFASEGMTLVPGQTSLTRQVFVRDLETGTTIWASTNAPVLTGDPGAKCYNAALTPDGRFLFFKCAPQSTSAAAFIVRHDLQAGTTLVISSNAAPHLQFGDDLSGPALNRDGSRLVYERAGNVYYWDAQTRASLLVSESQTGIGPANGRSEAPLLSPDGRQAAFLSLATDLVTNRTEGSFHIYLRDLDLNQTVLVDQNASGTGSSQGDALISDLTADGRWIAFSSFDDSLVAGDANRSYDVFIRDRALARTELISTRDTTQPALTANGASGLAAQGLSRDNRLVAFTSWASNLVTNDAGDFLDVYLHNVGTGGNTLVSANTNGVSANGMSHSPSLSSDGRFIAFVSSASDLVPGDTNGATDVFLRDFQSGSLTLVSAIPQGAGSGNGASAFPRISPNGRYVAFISSADNLVTNDTDSGRDDIFLRDVSIQATRLISTALPGGAVDAGTFRDPAFSADGNWLAFVGGALSEVYLYDLNRDAVQLITARVREPAAAVTPVSLSPRLSAGGRWVAFQSTRTDLVTNDFNQVTDVFVRDVATAATFLASIDVTGSTSAGAPPRSSGSLLKGFSDDGRYVLFQSDATNIVSRDENQSADVFMRDLRAGATILVSVNREGTRSGNALSDRPSISADGRFVVFRSLATDLVSPETDGQTNIFARDLLLGVTRLVSQNRQGTGGGNNRSLETVISADGGLVVFESLAADLVPNDFNQLPDLFLFSPATSSPADTDRDGLDDDWERAYFGDLVQTGEADSDGDGLTDLDEFRTGTNPVDARSALRLRLMPGGGPGGVSLHWPARFGRRYQVQFKAALFDLTWIDLPANVLFTGSTAMIADLTASGADQRYYRLMVLPE